MRNFRILESQLERFDNDRELHFKLAALHTFYNSLSLYEKGFYVPSIQQAVTTVDMCLKLRLWKKYRIYYTDIHNLPWERILEWFPEKERFGAVLANLREVKELHDAFGDYMEIVEDDPSLLAATSPREDSPPAFQDYMLKEKANYQQLMDACERVLRLVDSALPVILDFSEPSALELETTPRLYIEALNARDYEKLMSLFTDDSVVEAPEGRFAGIQEVRKFYEEVLPERYSELRLLAIEITATPGGAKVKGTIKGRTTRGRWFANVKFEDRFQLADGKIRGLVVGPDLEALGMLES